MRCLVYLWDQICSNCVQIGQSNLIDTLKNSPSSQKQLQGRAKANDASQAEAKKKKKKRGKNIIPYEFIKCGYLELIMSTILQTKFENEVFASMPTASGVVRILASR